MWESFLCQKEHFAFASACVRVCARVNGCRLVCFCVCVRRLIVVVAVFVAAGLLMKVCVIKSVHWGPRLCTASLKLHLIENGTAVMI